MPKVINLPTATTMDSGDFFVMEESGGGTKKITKSNALAELGTIVIASNTGTVTSIASSTFTDVCSVTLTKGKWLLVGASRIAGGSNFMGITCISETSATEQFAPSGGHAQYPFTSNTTSVGINVSRIVSVTQSSQTFYLVCWQNSGSAKTMDSGRSTLSAIRIG